MARAKDFYSSCIQVYNVHNYQHIALFVKYLKNRRIDI